MYGGGGGIAGGGCKTTRLVVAKINVRLIAIMILRGLRSCFFLIDSEGNLHAAER
jgi:hypothetical protein